MSDYVHLVGAEDVRTAAITMRSAAEQMQSAAMAIDSSLERHQRFLDEWLERFATVTRDVQWEGSPPKKKDAGCPASPLFEKFPRTRISWSRSP